MVHGHAKAQLLDIETKASFLIADEDDHGMKAEVRIAAVEPQQRSFNEGELVAAIGKIIREFQNVHGPSATGVYPVASGFSPVAT